MPDSSGAFRNMDKSRALNQLSNYNQGNSRFFTTFRMTSIRKVIMTNPYEGRHMGTAHT